MDRKEIVKALEVHLGAKAKYMGAPNFAYQIGAFTIDKVGKIINADGSEVELGRLLSSQNEEDETEMQGPIKFEVVLPMEGHTGTTLRNILNMIYSKQSLIKKVFGFDKDIVTTEFITEINKTDIQSLDDFKKVVDANSLNGLEFNFSSSTITFISLADISKPEKMEAFKQLVTLLDKTSRTLKYASQKPTETDNDKFTMRTWLIRLGMSGEEFKNTRKILLEGLEGSSAFRSPKEEIL